MQSTHRGKASASTGGCKCMQITQVLDAVKTSYFLAVLYPNPWPNTCSRKTLPSWNFDGKYGLLSTGLSSEYSDINRNAIEMLITQSRTSNSNSST